MSLVVRFKRNTAYNEVNRRILQLGVLGSQLVFEANGNVALSARVNVDADNELRISRAIRFIPQVESVTRT